MSDHIFRQSTQLIKYKWNKFYVLILFFGFQQYCVIDVVWSEWSDYLQ